MLRDEPPEANTNEVLEKSVLGADGGEILRKSASLAVAARSEKIVKKLADQAEKGHIASTKILVALVSNNETGKPLTKRQSKYIGELEIEAECMTSESRGEGEIEERNPEQIPASECVCRDILCGGLSVQGTLTEP